MSKKFLSPIKLAQGASNPAVGSAGELFFNTTDVKVYAHNGTSWVPSGGGVTVSATAPSTPIAGDAWYDTVDGTLYVYYNDGDSFQWVEVAANSGISVALEGRLGVVETYVTTLQSEMDTAQADIDAVEVRATSLENRAAALELADATTNKAGLVPVIASTVNYSGGAATSNSSGVIEFNSVTSISLNNVFTSAYRNYEFLLYGVYGSVDNAAPYFRFRAAGVDNSSSQYYYGGVVGQNSNGAASGWGAGVNSLIDLGRWRTSSSINLAERFNIFSPAISGIQSTIYGGGYWENSSSVYMVTLAGVVNNTAAYDGFSIVASSGNFSGFIQVLGYKA